MAVWIAVFLAVALGTAQVAIAVSLDSPSPLLIEELLSSTDAPNQCTPTPTDICPPGHDCGAGCSDSAISLAAAPCPSPHTNYAACPSYSGYIYCRDPEFGGVTYSVAPGCDPFGSVNCGLTATVSARFRGNNQNLNPGGSYSPAVVRLMNASGSTIGTCGTPGGPMRSDEGTVTVTWSGRCAVPASLTAVLEGRSCSCDPEAPPFACAFPNCTRIKTVDLDWSEKLGCELPLTFGCGDSNGASTASCCRGGFGGAPPVGGGRPLSREGSRESPTDAVAAVPRTGVGFVLPESGPHGFQMAYQYGGAGAPGSPENRSWYQYVGRFWNHSFGIRLVPSPDQGTVWLITQAGTYRRYSSLQSSGFYALALPADEYRSLEWLGSATGWVLHELDGTRIYFGANGLWDRTVSRNGQITQGHYDSLTRLDSVIFPDALSITFTYEDYVASNLPGSGKLSLVTEVPFPGSGLSPRTWTFAWVSDGSAYARLSTLTRPDGSRWRFGYDGTTALAHLSRVYLEGPNGSPSRVEAAWEYDSSGNLLRTWKGSETFSSGVDRYEWEYLSNSSTRIVDAYGGDTTYTFDREPLSGKPRVLTVVGDCPSCGLDPGSVVTYDNPSNPGHPLLPWRITDGMNTTSEMTYNARGRIATRTEALGTALERTTTWTYDSNYPAFATLEERPSVVPGCPINRESDREFDASNGNLLTSTERGCEEVDGTLTSYAYTTEYGYVGTLAGGPTSVNPPGFVASQEDLTTFDYDGSRGDQFLLSRSNTLLGTETYTPDGFNRRATVSDANGVITTTTFDALDRPKTQTREGATDSGDERTERYYTSQGDLFCIRLPEGNGVLREYESTTGRLQRETRGTAITTTPTPPTTCLQDALPRERVVYSYETYGRLTSERHERCSGTGCTWVLDAETSFAYSSRCHVDSQTAAPATSAAATTAYEYDCAGRMARLWDPAHPKASFPNAPTSVYRYDDLDRIKSVTQGWAPSGATCDVLSTVPDPDCYTVAYGYDAQDHLVQVIDGEGNETALEYSDRSLLTSQTSSASGVTSYGYNPHGQLETQTDARGIIATRDLDGADRVTSIAPGADPAILTTFEYGTDPLLFNVGRLRAIVRSTSSVQRGYDRFGRVTTDGGLTFSYDKNGRRRTITYPDSVVATYAFDFADRESSLSIDNPAATLVSGVLYTAGGPLRQLTFGTTPSRQESRTFDLRRQLDVLSVAGGLLSWDHTFDAAGNVTTISQTAPTAATRQFTYQDFQYFLGSASGPWGTRNWTYDKAGNRKWQMTGAREWDYVYETNGGGGNTSVLSELWTHVGESLPELARTYFFDEAGYLDLTDAPEKKGSIETITNFEFNGAGELSLLDPDGAKPHSLEYDGRGTLAQAKIGTSAYLTATYDSDGLLFSTLRTPFARGTQSTRVDLFYLAGRPVAQRTKVGTGSPTLTFLTTDHLGAPVLALNSNGTSRWFGGFEPFGRDWQEGTTSGALENGVFLRLPGQVDDPYWHRTPVSETAVGADLFYNVHRWYEPGTGRYASGDPLSLFGGGLNLALYGSSRPLAKVDPLGLATWTCSSVGFQAAFIVGASEQWGTCQSECSGGTYWLVNFDWRQFGFGASFKGTPFSASVWNFDDGWPTADPGNFRYLPQLCSTGWSFGFGWGPGSSSTGIEPSISGQSGGASANGWWGGGVFTGCGSFRVNQPRRRCCRDFPTTIGPANPDGEPRPVPTIGAAP